MASQTTDLKHMTSNSLLSPTSPSKDPSVRGTPNGGGRRTSQNLRVVGGGTGGGGVGSPGSIPSSPTSVHSSSSAIFERDIEPLLVSPTAAAGPSTSSHLTSPTSPHRPLDPHRIPRAKATEQLEQAVPSVLDSAAAILATLDITSDPAHGSSTSADVTSPGLDQVAVVAPASSSFFDGVHANGRSTNSGFASPLSFRSRSPSPSPLNRNLRSQHSTDLLLGIPAPVSVVSPHTLSSSAVSVRSASVSPPVRTVSLSATSSPKRAPGLVASVSRDSHTSGVEDDTQAIAGQPASPLSLPLALLGSGSAAAPSTSTNPHQPTTTTTTATTTTTGLSPSHPPSPHHAATKRLSFMSYSDLLSSTPASTLPLSSLTAQASTADPPPHIPSVSGLNLVSSLAHATGNQSTTASLRGFSMNSGAGAGGKGDSVALVDNVGGEWEREGLGMGLEERLDVAKSLLGGVGSVGVSPVGGVVRGLPSVKT